MIQAYILPTSDGWAVNIHGDDSIPDDTVLPLPWTCLTPLSEVLELFAQTPIGREASVVDGWEHRGELASLEPELYERTA